MSTIGERAVAYMAEMMDMHEAATDQEQNQFARHLTQFAIREGDRALREISATMSRVSNSFATGVIHDEKP